MAYACNAVIMIMVHVAMEMAFSFANIYTHFISLALPFDHV